MLKYGFDHDQSGGYRDFLPFHARVWDDWIFIDYSKSAADWMYPLKHGHEIDLVGIAANWYVDDLPPTMFIKGAQNSHGFLASLPLKAGIVLSLIGMNWWHTDHAEFVAALRMANPRNTGFWQQL